MGTNKLIRDIFKENRLRLSLPRLLIYQELTGSEGPLTAQELYHRLLKRKRRIGLTSIYRSLDLFESIGMVFRVAQGSNGRYQLCKLGDHHHHIICNECGHVVEFGFCEISNWARRVTESTGYRVTGHQLSFYGLCGPCQKGR